MEYKRNREEKHQWRIGDLSWYEGGGIFSATVHTLFLNPNRCPLMGRVGPFFGILTQMKSSLQMSWLVQVNTCLLTSVTVLLLPNIFSVAIVMLLFLSLTLSFFLSP